jgi:chloride channel 3/4/5
MSEDTPLLEIRTNNDQRLNIESRPNDGQKARPLTIWTKFNKRFDKDILTPAVGRRSWYHDYTTIDWLHDMIKDKMRLSSLADKGFLKRNFDAAQAWIVLTIVGMLCGLTASFIYVSINWLTDIRSGYCMDDWRLTRSACCSTSECVEWNYWVLASYAPMLNTITATALALIACIPVTLAVYKSESNTFYYYSAGSGIPQVKTILGGFVIRGCLGLRTLLVKSVSLILTVSSGLMMGQQGPIVHISCCIGNVVSRIFSKYSMNDAKRREILSAASAAGVSVAFGAPIGGVLFSLEEVSYYFPSKTMWRSFYCALIAAMTLKYTNPDKYLLFESHIEADWNSFDIIFFVIIGLFGGLFGAFFIASSRAILKFEKSQGIYFKFLRVLVVSALTAYLSYLLPYNEISNNQLITFLFSQCNSTSSNVICEISNEKFGTFFTSWITMAFLMIITFGIHLPGGIFVPSMVVGALGYIFFLTFRGRITALLAQNLATNLVNIKIEPAIYAMVGAASTISGVTRMTVSLIIIMFEITGSLRHVVPLMIAIMVSKWSSDALEKDSIYDTCIKLLEYPYLDHKRTQLISASLDTVMEVSVPIIQMDREYTVYELELKLEDLKVRFPNGDGGFPVLTSQNILKGYVGISDLEHALYIIQQKRIDWEYLPIVIPHSTTSYKEVFDISAWIDRSPIMVTSDTSLELVLELFMKLGIKTLMIVDSGKFAGLVHKKQLLGFLKGF